MSLHEAFPFDPFSSGSAGFTSSQKDHLSDRLAIRFSKSSYTPTNPFEKISLEADPEENSQEKGRGTQTEESLPQTSTNGDGGIASRQPSNTESQVTTKPPPKEKGKTKINQEAKISVSFSSLSSPSLRIKAQDPRPKTKRPRTKNKENKTKRNKKKKEKEKNPTAPEKKV